MKRPTKRAVGAIVVIAMCVACGGTDDEPKSPAANNSVQTSEASDPPANGSTSEPDDSEQGASKGDTPPDTSDGGEESSTGGPINEGDDGSDATSGDIEKTQDSLVEGDEETAEDDSEATDPPTSDPDEPSPGDDSGDSSCQLVVTAPDPDEEVIQSCRDLIEDLDIPSIPSLEICPAGREGETGCYVLSEIPDDFADRLDESCPRPCLSIDEDSPFVVLDLDVTDTLEIDVSDQLGPSIEILLDTGDGTILELDLPELDTEDIEVVSVDVSGPLPVGGP